MNCAGALHLVFQAISSATNPLRKSYRRHLSKYVAEPHLIQPTIIYDFPLAVSPALEEKTRRARLGRALRVLHRRLRSRQRLLRAQRPRATSTPASSSRLNEKERGDDEAHQMDEDYVRALGYGLPPTAGEGIGIDRLTMLLTNSKSIRDVILFPLMRPIQKNPEQVAEKQNQPHGESAE